jgi:hypothetical protein
MELAMKIDHDFLKALLEAFEQAQKPTTDINELAKAGVLDDEGNFIFHMKILEDKCLIERNDGDAGFGLYQSADGCNSWAVVPLRLTANGHAFIEALENKEVWSAIKKDFKNASIDTLWRVSKDLLDGYLKKKTQELLGY